ncbi:transketolase [Andreesenia angusta]|uniref:Transketolase n=1 Tax=Andreesenia angusta TaxID=39480 RepID=A0A1S1V8M5_9FIRM|nr:transketolase [Andreesenia angusta]OHW62948.1 transketolase [Andreesenia angusta]
MNIDRLAVNTIRVLSAEAVQKANSGHPGLPLGAAPMAYTLWSRIMKHNPENPNWINRDRFVLSAGHGSMLLYSLLHMFGYDLSMEEIKNFRQLGSQTPGHPEYGHTVGVETTTGPLGQGLANAVGMAMAEAHLASLFNTEERKIVDHYTYAIVGDGCMMEGITNEASSLAGTLGLSKLIVLYDSNNISIEGDTDLAFREDVGPRYEALGWDVQFVEDGNDLDVIEEAILNAKSNTEKPSFIEIKTRIGYGSAKEGQASAHGEPLGEENVAGLKSNLGWEHGEEFVVPEKVKSHMQSILAEKKAEESDWNKEYKLYKKENPELAAKFEAFINAEIPKGYLNSEEFYSFEKDMATRQSSEVVLNRIAEKMPQLFGGSADLAPSNKTVMKSYSSFSKEDYGGSNIHFGVREHAMASVSNGIALHGGLVPYCATFLIFSDYLKPAFRLSAIMNKQVIYVLTHDSIGVGEDGPTHQPIEQLSMLRATPNAVVFRPCDAKEVAASWAYALERKDGPTALALTRQTVRNLEETGKDALKGGYVLKDFGDKVDIIIISSGSEVSLAYDAAVELCKRGIGVRVVSMPSMEVFEAQSPEYKESVLPSDLDIRISVEAGATMPWYRYIGPKGVAIGIDRFGASAPGDQLFEEFELTVERVVKEAIKILE